MIIVISSPDAIHDEQKNIKKLFVKGLAILHLRKKNYSENQLRLFIESIPAGYYRQIVLHSHYHLTAEYGLRGIHVPFAYSGDVIMDKSVSISFHAQEEIISTSRPFEYGFLSPVFDSISKPGYRSRFDLDKLGQFMAGRNERIIALGGIDEDNIQLLWGKGFSGIALLGAIWQSHDPVDKFKRVKEKWESLINVNSQLSASTPN